MVKDNSDINEYFVWEPANNSKKHIYNNGVDGMQVIYFNLNIDKKGLSNLRRKGRKVNGLANIVIKGNSKKEDSSEIYNLSFDGRIKPNITNANKEGWMQLALREQYNETSKRSMRKKREKVYSQEVKKYFSTIEFDEMLNKVKEMYNNQFSDPLLRSLINSILDKKGISREEQGGIHYQSMFWQKTIKDFMNEREYVKKGDKYVKQK